MRRILRLARDLVDILNSHPKAAILTIGDELLKGSVFNTNAFFLARELTGLGFAVSKQLACGDSVSAIKRSLDECAAGSDLVVLSGGLGPTPDDVTREAVSQYFRSPLILSSRQYSFIRRHYARKKKSIPAMVRTEAMFPKNAVPLFNHYGIALGFYLDLDGKVAVVLPGVPNEMEKMFKDLVVPLLRRKYPQLQKKFRLVIKTVGLSEPEVMKKLRRDFFKDSFEFGIYPEAGEAALRLYAESSAVIKRLKAKVRSRLAGSVYAEEEISLAEAIGRLLRRRRASLAVAESCTGGRLASEITQIPGSSGYFKGGVVAYANEIKKGFLGIPPAMLKSKGAISAEVAAALAAGVRDRMKTTFGIGITGIAGPTGASKGKPVGLVFISIATDKKRKVWREQFSGDRNQIQHRAMKKALAYLWYALA